MMKDFSPEEKLLHLIRGKKGKNKEEKNPSGNLKFIERVFGKFVKIEKESYSGKMHFNFTEGILHSSIIKNINISLGFVTVLLLGYLAVDFFIIAPGFLKQVLVKPQELILSSEEGRDREIRPYSYYSTEIGRRDIFKTPILKEEVPDAGKEDISSNLSLLGIAAGTEKPQAIIEDKKTKKTYFLTEGDYINQMKVESIENGKVILNYNGEKVELGL